MSDNFEINSSVWAETWKAWALGILLLLATVAVVYAVQPSFLYMENQNIRASQGYITTQQSALRQYKTSYDVVSTRLAETPDDESHRLHRRGLQDQQRSIILQMRQSADLIPGNVPPDIRDFLASH